MNKEFYEFICKTINELTGNNQQYNTENDLTTYEINSLSFIKMIVAIEDKYDFEFEDQFYSLDKMNTIDVIYAVTKKYVKDLE